MLGVNRLQRPPQVRGRGSAPATRALSRPVSWRPIDQDYNVSKLFVQEIRLGSSSVTVMGESAEELAEKSLAAMVVYHQAGFLPTKSPARAVYRAAGQSGIEAHHALRPRPELHPSFFQDRVSHVKIIKNLLISMMSS